MKEKNKKSIIIGFFILIIVTLIIVGITYAYYRTKIFGNPNGESISVTAKDLEVTYSDGTAIVNMSGEIEPGYEYTKTFTVTNTGNSKTSYGIKLDNIICNIKRTSDWVYTLKKGNEVLKENVRLPLIESYILFNESIESEEEDTYTLIITYKNLPDIDQSDDMGGSLSLRVNIGESKGHLFNAGEGTLLAAIAKDNSLGIISDKTKEQVLTKHTIIEGEEETLAADMGYYDIWFTYADSYEYDNKTGTFTLINAKHLESNEGPLTGKYLAKIPEDTYEPLQPTENLTTIYKVTSDMIENSQINLTYLPLTSSVLGQTIVSSIPGKEVSRTDETLFLSTEDDYGTSYYFRGKVDNNFVNYSGMCWRIVRVLGNGNIKLALADENNLCNSSSYNTSNISAFIFSNSGGYIYYKDSNTVDDVIFETSNIPGLLESWATRSNKPLDTTDLVTDVKWCNDMSLAREDGVEKYYGGNERLINLATANPSLKCDMEGTRKYENSVGILTADEIAFAGSTYWEDGLVWDYYLMDNTRGKMYWTITPSSYTTDYYGKEYFGSDMFYAGGDGFIWSYVVTSPTSFIRPAIVLKSTAIIEDGGIGTQENPYVIN